MLEPAEAEVIVHNLLGKQVYSTKVNAQPGDNELEFDGTNLSNGIYFYTLKYNNFTETKRMILTGN